MNVSSPWTMLGLPDPSTAAVDDAALLTVYREFCAGLKPDSDGRFVAADGYLFYSGRSRIKDEDYSLIRLLRALYHPNKTQMDNVRKRLSHFIRYRNSCGDFDGHIYDPEIVACYREFQNFAATPDYGILTGNTADARTLGRVHCEQAAFPGGCYDSELHVSRYSRDWNAVFWWGDAEDEPFEAFPTILGFARTDDRDRNVVALMRQETLFTAPSKFMTVRGVSDLVALSWLRDDDEFDYAEFFLQFPDAALGVIGKEYGGLLDRVLLEKALDVQGVCGNVDLADVIAEHGLPKGPGYFDKLKVWAAAAEWDD